MKITDTNNIVRDCENVTLDRNFPGYVKADFVSKVRVGYKHSEWFPLDEFLANNPNLKKTLGTILTTPHEDLGVVSKSGQDYIQDNAKDWKKNIFAGVPVWISRGKGEGEQRTVTKNGKNIFYIDKPWKEIPDKTSQYVISFNVAKNIKPVGNNLPGIETKSMLNKLIKKAKKSL